MVARYACKYVCVFNKQFPHAVDAKVKKAAAAVRQLMQAGNMLQKANADLPQAALISAVNDTLGSEVPFPQIYMYIYASALSQY